MNKIEEFRREVAANIGRLSQDHELQALCRTLLTEMTRYKYPYNFSWMGRPIIQLPQDIVAMQELIWKVQPDLIVETGIAHGGSLIFHASMLELLGGDRRVLGIDIDIREHNRAEIESHPMSRRIDMIQGSSIDEAVAAQVRAMAAGRKRVLVSLDSNHTHEHVLRELELYSLLVGEGSYLVVFDTAIEDVADTSLGARPWGKGNNPKTAVREFLRGNDRFEIDRELEAKLLLTVAPEGYLKCVRN
jgi:cephalosporin hydroxylase